MKKLFSSLFLLVWFLNVQAQTQKLTPELLLEMGRLSLEDASKDGKTALYVVTYYDLDANRGTTNLYSVDLMTNESKQLTDVKGNVGNVRFNKDGRIIYYLVDGMLHRMNADGTSVVKLSETEMNGFALSPNEDKVLYVSDVKYTKMLGKEIYPDMPNNSARIMDDLMYRHWKSWEDGSYSNIFVADLSGDKLASEMNIMKDEPYDAPLAPMGGMEQICWSPDGKSIAYTCKKMNGKDRATSTDSDIYIYNLTTKATANLTKGMVGYDMNPTYSPDGKYLAWNSMERPMFEADRNRIFLVNLQTNAKEELTVGVDREANQPTWASDSKSMYYIGGDKATYQIYSIDVKQKKERQLTQGQHDYQAFVLAGEHLVASKMDMSNPSDLFLVHARTGQVKQITNVNQKLWSSVKKGKVEKRMVKTTDGKEMLVWVILPTDFDPSKKYPTLLYCQGGPQSAVSQFFSYRWNFQMMANNGYIIVAPNRRGLPTFGQKWNDEISGDWGGQCMKDYLSAIDDVVKEPYVNKDKMGAVGASFGGYSVYWLAGNHNKRFKAFISHCGVFNLESMYGTTEEVFFSDFEMGGPYWNKNAAAEYRQFSPSSYVQNWDTPILVIHNELDFRVPFSEGMQAFQAARLRNIPAKFLDFPDEGHWVQKPQNSVVWNREFYAWLDKWLK